MMQYKGYLAHVEYDDDSNIFHGEVINTRDVITFQGKSVETLKKAFTDSVEDYLAFCKARGDEPDKPFTGRLTVHLSPVQHKKIIMAAEKLGKHVDAWVADALIQAARQHIMPV
jgi:predicted HicB family RNase H-like nuclease